MTSAGSGDGKTTTAINLAISLREGIRGKVLLLEGNLSEPGVARQPLVAAGASVAASMPGEPP